MAAATKRDDYIVRGSNDRDEDGEEGGEEAEAEAAAQMKMTTETEVRELRKNSVKGAKICAIGGKVQTKWKEKAKDEWRRGKEAEEAEQAMKTKVVAQTKLN